LFNDKLLAHLAVNHSIFVKRTVILGAVLKGEDAVAVLEVFSPFTLVL
jgi:hypothetical protein